MAEMDYFSEQPPEDVVYLEAAQLRRKDESGIRLQAWLNPAQNAEIGDYIRLYRTKNVLRVVDIIGKKGQFKLVEMVYGY